MSPLRASWAGPVPPASGCGRATGPAASCPRGIGLNAGHHQRGHRAGAEFNAELERSRAIAGGRPPGQEPFAELRDTRKLDKGARRSAAGPD